MIFAVGFQCQHSTLFLSAHATLQTDRQVWNITTQV